MYLKTTSLLLFFFIHVSLTALFAMDTHCSGRVTIINEANSVDITIAIYENTAKIIVPADIDIRIARRNCIPVSITVDYKVAHTNLGNFRLAIRSPATTLVPVKIPPPPSGFINISQENSTRVDAIVLNRCINGERLNAGNHSLYFSLEKCSDERECNSINDVPPENVIHRNSVDFLVYDLVDLGISSVYWIPNQNADSFMLKYIISNMARDAIDSIFKVKFYVSEDTQLDDKDTLFSTKIIHRIASFNDVELNLRISKEVHEKFTNKYIICNLDANHDIDELNEDNNLSNYFIAPYKDLEINTIEISRPPGTYGAYITCTIANKDRLSISETTITNLYYHDNWNTKVLDSQKLPPVATNGIQKVKFYLDLNDYYSQIEDYTLSITADANHHITETNENNNEIKFKIPAIQNGETITIYPTTSRMKTKEIIKSKEKSLSAISKSLKKVYPNPFQEKINFSISTPNKKSTISLIVFNTAGTVVDKIISKRPSKGVQLFTYENIDLPGGFYFYILWIDNESYKGSFIKK